MLRIQKIKNIAFKKCFSLIPWPQYKGFCFKYLCIWAYIGCPPKFQFDIQYLIKWKSLIMCSVLDPMMEEVVHLEWHCHHPAFSGEAQLGLRSSQSLWELPGCSPSCPSCHCRPRPPTAWSRKESCTPRHSCSHPNHG